MKEVKSRHELKLSDLPLIESPFTASTQTRQLINDRHVRISRNHHNHAMDERELAKALRDGDLFLVFSGVGIEKPFNPLITWKSDNEHPNGGLWQLQQDSIGLGGIEGDIEALNGWEVTPETIQQGGPGCVGHVQSYAFNSTMIQRRAEERFHAQQTSNHKLTLPLGAAASVAPLASSAAASPAPPPKTQEKEKPQKKAVHLEVGIFTDGTLNNAGNIEIYRQRIEEECVKPRENGDIDDAECERRLALLMGESYANGPSNVAKLFDLYAESDDKEGAVIKARRRVYMPGAGSKTGSPDSLQGMATGLGETGVTEQVKSAFSEAAKLISDIASLGELDQLTIDLFGFSRGGAAARHAANEIETGPEGQLGEAFAELGIQWPDKVIIRFIGLFDTVAGIVNIAAGDWSAGNDRNAPVNLYLGSDIARTVVQFTALDECRANFSLNSLRGPDGNLPANFHEFALPGVHSDIGGGYHERQTEDLLLSPTLTVDGSDTAWPEQTMEWDNLATLKAATEAEGWIGPESPKLPSGKAPSVRIHKTVREHPVPDGRVDLDLKLQREVLGGLSQVYLHCMYGLARRQGVPLNDIRTAKRAAEIPKELQTAHRILSEQIYQGSRQPRLPTQQVATLKQRYTHHSDHFNWTEALLNTLFGDVIFKGEVPFKPFRPAPERKRIVHANQPARKARDFANRAEA